MNFFKLEFTDKVITFNLLELKDYDNRSNGYILKTDNTDLLSKLDLKANLKRLVIIQNNEQKVIKGIQIKHADLSTGVLTILHNVTLK